MDAVFQEPEASFRKVVETFDVREGPIVLGVSGGVDSVCLLHVTADLAPRYGLRPHVVHVHHGLRGAEADEDAAFVEAEARRLGLPVTVVRVDVARAAQAPGVSVEEAARQWRYAVLGREARRVAARWVAVAHHADDQVETVLMHLLRGAGLAGLRGMLPVTWYGHLRLPLVPPAERPDPADLWLVRPLLYTPRAAIASWVEARGLSYRFDRSNLDTTFFRNRLRHEVLPMLEQVNPQVRHALFALAELAAADFDLLQALAREAWLSVHRGEGAGWVRFDLAGWRALPLALRRGVLRDAVMYLRRELRDVGFGQVERARRFLEDPRQQAGAECTLPAGLVVRREYRTFLVAEADVGTAPWAVPQVTAAVTVSGPGQYALSPEWVMDVALLDREAVGDAWRRNPDRWTAYFDADALAWPLVVRPRQPGERLRPLGMQGKRVLISDLLANAKVPRWTRERWPVLADARGEGLWVVGVRQADVGRITPATRRVLVVRVLLRGASPSDPGGEGG